METIIFIGIAVVLLLVAVSAYVFLIDTSNKPPTIAPPARDESKFDTTLNGWQPIAQDGGMFGLVAPATIRWGADTRMVDMNMFPGLYFCGSGPIFQDNVDPAYGTVKQCFIDSSQTARLSFATTGPYVGSWTPIADAPDGIRTTTEPIDVRFGTENVYLQRRIDGKFTCKPLTFGGSPPTGVANKCYVKDPSKLL